MIKRKPYHKEEGLTLNSTTRTIDYLKANCNDCEKGVEHVNCPIQELIKEWSTLTNEQKTKHPRKY